MSMPEDKGAAAISGALGAMNLKNLKAQNANIEASTAKTLQDTRTSTANAVLAEFKTAGIDLLNAVTDSGNTGVNNNLLRGITSSLGKTAGSIISNAKQRLTYESMMETLGLNPQWQTTPDQVIPPRIPEQH